MAINRKLIYRGLFIISVLLNVITVFYFIDRKVYFGYMRRHQFETQKWNALFSTETDSKEIIFIGTSLTEGFMLRSSFNNRNLKNMGFGGLESDQILQNLKRIIVRKPPKIFLEQGINDIRSGRKLRWTYNNFVSMCNVTKQVSPNTRLYIQSVLPTLSYGFNAKIKTYNTAIKNYCSLHKLTYIDMYDGFLQDGAINALATADGIHLTPYGYYLWKKHLEPYIAQ